MTHYEILGVAESASADEIKRAYRKLASQHHPDKGGDVKKFQEIEQAYRILSDPGQRQQYDLERQGGGGFRFTVNGQEMSGSPLDEMLRNFGFQFGGNPFHKFHQHQRRNKDLRINIDIPLSGTLSEQKKTVSVQTTNGHRETVEVTIPRGVVHGTSIKYSGLGDNFFSTIPRGDLYVHINVQNTENFAIHGIDLYTVVSVNCFVAAIGGNVQVTGLDGRIFELTIPPGSQPGTKFRLAEQGLYQMNSNNKGHLYIELSVSVPTNLTSDQVDLLKSILNQ